MFTHGTRGLEGESECATCGTVAGEALRRHATNREWDANFKFEYVNVQVLMYKLGNTIDDH